MPVVVVNKQMANEGTPTGRSSQRTA